jgi:hypothetical protein
MEEESRLPVRSGHPKVRIFAFQTVNSHTVCRSLEEGIKGEIICSTLGDILEADAPKQTEIGANSQLAETMHCSGLASFVLPARVE